LSFRPFFIGCKTIFNITIILVLFSCSNSDKNKTVAIQTLNGFPLELTDSIRNSIEDYYHFKTVIYNDIKIPQRFYINVKSPRYRADSIINYLRVIKPDSINYIIGLTTVDISTTKRDENGVIRNPEYKYKDWGVFGLGYRPGASCVISTFRVKTGNKKQYYERMQKIALHELGHNLGLPHCENKNCLMRDAAETIKTIDQVNLNLCQKCFDKI
jgi:archaemetzincin